MGEEHTLGVLTDFLAECFIGGVGSQSSYRGREKLAS